MRRPFIICRSNLNSVCCSFSYLPAPKIEIYREHASTVSRGPFSHHVTNSAIRPAPLNGCAPSAHLPIVGLQDPLVSTSERFISTGWRRPMPTLWLGFVFIIHSGSSKTANSQKMRINCVRSILIWLTFLPPFQSWHPQLLRLDKVHDSASLLHEAAPTLQHSAGTFEDIEATTEKPSPWWWWWFLCWCFVVPTCWEKLWNTSLSAIPSWETPPLNSCQGAEVRDLLTSNFLSAWLSADPWVEITP